MIGDARRDDDDDAGFTLLEVLVGMSILSIFLAIFGGSMISMFNSVNHTQQTSDAQSQVNMLFVDLDHEIRYASGISQPAANVFATGDYVVEFVSEYSGTATCTQLRLTPSGDLLQRSWARDAAPIVMSASTVLATNISPDAPIHASDPSAEAAGPFVELDPAGSTSNQRLEIAITAQDPGVNTRSRHTDVTFTALNTGTSTLDTESVCSQGRSIAWPAP